VSESLTMRQLREPAVLRDLEAYWTVYERVLEDVQRAVAEELQTDPALAQVVEAAFRDTELQGRMQSLFRQALRDGQWQPYLTVLREAGVTFARKGLQFGDWFHVLNAFRRHTVPHLLEAYGDDHEQLAAAVRGKGRLFDLALQTLGEAYLDERESTIAKQRAAIAELSTPVLQIRPGLLLMPIIGVVDSARSRQLTETLLHAIQDSRARVVVMDITGVAEVDSEVANRLIQAAEAARLMGATPIITGISTGVAQTLVAVGVDLKGLRTVGDLQGGIEEADELIRSRNSLGGQDRQRSLSSQPLAGDGR
jgi:rsbT co-antagonist protein RsbR